MKLRRFDEREARSSDLTPTVKLSISRLSQRSERVERLYIGPMIAQPRSSKSIRVVPAKNCIGVVYPTCQIGRDRSKHIDDRVIASKRDERDGTSKGGIPRARCVCVCVMKREKSSSPTSPSVPQRGFHTFFQPSFLLQMFARWPVELSIRKRSVFRLDRPHAYAFYRTRTVPPTRNRLYVPLPWPVVVWIV